MPTSALLDGELVGQVLTGRRDAFGALVERYLKAATAVARLRLLNPADAEDAVQEGFLRAYERLGTLNDRAKFGPWLMAIARREAIRLYARRQTTLGGEAPDAVSEGVAPDPDRKETNALIRERVSGLPEMSREVLMLHYFAEYSTREIAALLEIRQGAVLKRLQRAREQLAETLLRDLEVDKPSTSAVANQAARILALTSALAIESVAAKATSTGALVGIRGVSALFPKAATVAAAAAGMVFTVAVGWVYLAGPTMEAGGIALDPPLAFSPVTEQGPAVAEENPPEESLPAAIPSATEPVPKAVVTESVIETKPAKPAVTYPNATGRWDFTAFMGDEHEEHIGAVEIKDMGSVLEFVAVEAELQDFFHECRRENDTITLDMGDPDATGRLTGQFDVAFTELTLKGNIDTGSTQEIEPFTVEITLVGKRLEPNTLSLAERVRLLRDEMQEFHERLKEYLAATGAYPSQIEELSPRFIEDIAPYRSTATRTIAYSRPTAHDNEAIQELTHAAMEAATEDELETIEAQLIALWGDRFLGADAILDVRDTELNVHLRLRAIGRIDEVVDFDPAEEEESAAVRSARTNAQNASCMNNMKQLGLVARMFQHEQAVQLMPAGWRMTYPAYMADTRILTCPGGEPGTESYELVFAGATLESLHALGRTVEGLPADTPEGEVGARVPFLLERDHCSGLEERNVLFVDGHVERLSDDEWNAAIEPYLR